MKDWSSIVRNLAAAGAPSAKGAAYVTEVVSSPPSRNPTSSGRNNLLVDLASAKMGHAVPVESLTLEAAHAQMMEIGREYIGYWPQPRPLPVLCTCRDGKQRKLWLTFDFLVIVGDRVELHECKPEAQCLRLAQDFPGRYQKNDEGRWYAPEVEAALAEYGLTFRIITEANVPPTLVRNHALLAEVAGKEYSTPTAAANILNELGDHADGLPLKALLERAAGHGYAKNDIYLAIAKQDVFAPLANVLLVDDKTTRLFGQAHQAEAYRLRHFNQPEPQKGTPLVLRADDPVMWNGVRHTVCNISKNAIYLRSLAGDPVKFPRDLLFGMIASGEIVIPEEILRSREKLAEEIGRRFKNLTAENQALGIKRLQFLDFLERHPEAKPEHFGLPAATLRTVQRWKEAARDALLRFGAPIWGLIDLPRPGRPRDVLDEKVRALATDVANELYFSKEQRSANYCWREFRKRCEVANLLVMSKGAFRRHLRRMKNLRETVEDRQGEGVAYKYGCAPVSGSNWIIAGDFPFKLGQMDGKLNDIVVIDDETGEPLGRPSLTLIILPHYGVPIGMALMLEPPSYRSATMALRDALNRFGELPRFLFVDNGREFNNANFDKLLAILRVSKVNRPPHDPRFSAEIESLFRTLDVEVIHNLAGNTQASRDPREMTDETKPDKHAVWTFSALYDALEKYCFELLWDAPAASLGTTPRKAFERDRARAPQGDQFTLPPEVTDLAFLPEVKGRTRLVNPGRGVYVEGYYYWNDALAKPGIERMDVPVRYDPYNLSHVYVMVQGEAIECVARHAPELRNLTERHRHLACLSRRRLKNNHEKTREETHGRRLEGLGEDNRAKEKQLREERRARAQQHAIDKHRDKPNQKKPTGTKISMPKVNFSHLRKSA